LLTRAIVLQELETSAYCVEMEFAYDNEDLAVELLRIVKDLRAYLARLSLRPDALLTLDRQCPRCSGRGACTPDEPVCVECDGSGRVRVGEEGGTP
jgi:hypothetical protein